MIPREGLEQFPVDSSAALSTSASVTRPPCGFALTVQRPLLLFVSRGTRRSTPVPSMLPQICSHTYPRNSRFSWGICWQIPFPRKRIHVHLLRSLRLHALEL
ncbi:hypothetical protein LZ32DRAFT_114403 [Colletotrichum eremochloae]|nr:hypothetical protein LZ32DRAFT_114403 [Colletotrichum eremochloae]